MAAGGSPPRTSTTNNDPAARPTWEEAMAQLNRRKFLGASAAAIGAGATTGISIPTSWAADASTLRLGMGAAKVGTIDPIKLTQGVDNWAICHVFDLLMRPPDGRFPDKPEEYKPSLAESWKRSDDAKTWTFNLRKGVKFHKGYGEVTAADVKFSFDRARDPKAGSVSSITYQNITDVQTEGDLVVKFVLGAPDPFFLTSVIYNTASNVVSKKAVEEKGDKFAMDPIGTGPYQIASVTPELVKLSTNPDHFAGKPATPNMEIQYIVDTSARTFAILGGTADMILAPAGPGTIDAIMQQDKTMQMDVALPGNSWSIAFNLAAKPFDNLKVRQAFLYAIDREAIAKSLTPPVPRVYGLNPPVVPGSLGPNNTPKDLLYPYDPAKAKAQLAEAGYKDGLSFSTICSQRDDYSSLMLIVQDQLRKAGVNMELKMMDHTAFHAEDRKGLGLFILRGGSYPPVPTFPIANEVLAIGDTKPDGKGGNNFSHYGVAIPGIDDLFAKAMAEPDLEKRLDLCRQMEIKMLTDLPIISLTTTAYVIIRAARMDIGFKVNSGYGYWRLDRAKIKV
jgi:peptide/nickel transport system substrate-binding protein